jgi:homoserine dehydrogenase
VAILGASGAVGNEFLEQMKKSKKLVDDPKAGGKRKALSELRLDYKVTALARSKVMRLSYDGIDVSEGFDGTDEQMDTDLEGLTRFLEDDFNGNRVVIDCTASQEVADYYPRWLGAGMHVIATNKLAGSGPADLYDRSKDASLASSAQWLYETTGPGSGLPLLATLKDMTQSGDDVQSVSGRFSASISFIFSKLREGVPLSRALAAAVEKGLCEPDPRDDLNGVDNVRSLVVLGRELGLQLEVEDVECESLLPTELSDWAPDTSPDAPPLVDQLCKALEPYDVYTACRVSSMLADGFVPAQISTVDVTTGKASVKAFAALPAADRMSQCKGGDIIVEIKSRIYSESPMVLQGPGGGLEITAAGLFGDLLRLSRSLVEWNVRKSTE